MQGEYVAAEKLEGVYGSAEAVDQIWVYGSSERSSLVAVVVPDLGHLRHAREAGLLPEGVSGDGSSSGGGAAADAAAATRSGASSETARTSRKEDQATPNDDEAVRRLVRLPAVRESVLRQLQAVAKKSRLRGFEVVKAVHLDPQPFTVDNGLLTPTFKLKRPQLLSKYRADIDAMYASLDASEH